MTRKPRFPRVALPVALVLAVAFSAPAMADLVATEQDQGAQILTQVQHGQLRPKSLTTAQYENLGEYLMGQALGSTQLHQRMNTLMDEMMGPTAADQMHVYLGKRYLGVSITASSRYTALYGLMGVMMSGYRGSPLAGMMSRYLSGQTAAGYRPGPGMMGSAYGHTTAANSSNGGWPTGAIVATAVLAALLLAAALALALPKLRRRNRSATPATS